MGELIQQCQRSVNHRVGVFVRMEAIRTEKHQTRYRPLQPYVGAKTVVKYSPAVAAGVDVGCGDPGSARLGEPGARVDGEPGTGVAGIGARG